MARNAIDPQEIDGAIDAAKFVSRCDVTGIQAESGEIIIDLSRAYDEKYTLYMAMSRVSRRGDQVILKDRQTDERIYEG